MSDDKSVGFLWVSEFPPGHGVRALCAALAERLNSQCSILGWVYFQPKGAPSRVMESWRFANVPWRKNGLGIPTRSESGAERAHSMPWRTDKPPYEVGIQFESGLKTCRLIVDPFQKKP